MITNKALMDLLRVVKSYEIAVLAGGEHAQEFRARLQSQLNFEIAAGHKRVVVDDPSDPGYVLKIAASMEGVLGNLNEIIVYQRICELVDMGQIPAECKYLFARTEFLDASYMDPFIIRQVKGITPFKNQNFIEFIRNRMPAGSRDITPMDYWGLYISQNPNLNRCSSIIQEVLSNHIAASDVNPNDQGLNYSECPMNGQQQLMLNDMDSCIPLIINQFGEYDRPKCPKCFQPMQYVPVIINSPITDVFDQRLRKGSYYACKNPGCLHNIENVNSPDPYAKGEITDTTVYGNYRMEHMPEILYMYMDKCSYFIPSEPIRTYGEYTSRFLELKPTANEREITVGFNNYINSETAKTLLLFWDIIGSWENNGQIRTLSYFDFRINLQQAATNRNIALGPIQYRAIAFLYISYLAQIKGDAYNVFGVYNSTQLDMTLRSIVPTIHPANVPGNQLIMDSYNQLLTDLLSII